MAKQNQSSKKQSQPDKRKAPASKSPTRKKTVKQSPQKQLKKKDNDQNNKQENEQSVVGKAISTAKEYVHTAYEAVASTVKKLTGTDKGDNDSKD